MFGRFFLVVGPILSFAESGREAVSLAHPQARAGGVKFYEDRHHDYVRNTQTVYYAARDK